MRSVDGKKKYNTNTTIIATINSIPTEELLEILLSTGEVSALDSTIGAVTTDSLGAKVSSRLGGASSIGIMNAMLSHHRKI
jgi:hypothetical protein